MEKTKRLLMGVLIVLFCGVIFSCNPGLCIPLAIGGIIGAIIFILIVSFIFPIIGTIVGIALVIGFFFDSQNGLAQKDVCGCNAAPRISLVQTVSYAEEAEWKSNFSLLKKKE